MNINLFLTYFIKILTKLFKPIFLNILFFKFKLNHLDSLSMLIDKTCMYVLSMSMLHKNMFEKIIDYIKVLVEKKYF